MRRLNHCIERVRICEMSKRPKITLDNFFRRKQLCHDSNSIEISQSLTDDVFEGISRNVA